MRESLKQPGPMLPPVPAVVTAVKGDDASEDELSVLWTFILGGSPPRVGVSAADEHAIRPLLQKHREFTLNVPTTDWAHGFDVVDMNSSKRGDKFELAGLTRGQAETINAPTVGEAAIVLECRVLQEHELPPDRVIFVAEVCHVTYLPGVVDESGRLIAEADSIFGMAAGCGEFRTLGSLVGHIGMTVDRDDIKY